MGTLRVFVFPDHLLHIWGRLEEDILQELESLEDPEGGTHDLVVVRVDVSDVRGRDVLDMLIPVPNG